MCAVSMIMEHKADEWWRRFYTPPPVVFPNSPPPPYVYPNYVRNPPTQEEIDEFRRLLDRAREYDKEHNQPDCELEEKRQKLKKMAQELGVEIDFV